MVPRGTAQIGLGTMWSISRIRMAPRDLSGDPVITQWLDILLWSSLPPDGIAGWRWMDLAHSGVVDWKMIGKIYCIIMSKTNRDATQRWNSTLTSGQHLWKPFYIQCFKCWYQNYLDHYSIKKIENCYPSEIFLPDNLETCRVGRKKEEWKTIRDLSARLMLHRVMWRQLMSLLV